MTTQFTPKTFLRQTSNDLLQACFAKLNVLQDLPWTDLANHQIDVIYDSWQNLPEPQRLEVERMFEEADALASEEGTKTIIDEGTFHGLDLASELEPFQNFRDKAMHVAISHPRVFQVAGTINHAHSLSLPTGGTVATCPCGSRTLRSPRSMNLVRRSPDTSGRTKGVVTAARLMPICE